MRLAELTDELSGGAVLEQPQIDAATAALLDESAADDDKADFLRALHQRGERAEEIAGFVQAFLARALKPPLHTGSLPGPALDVCGTGGDHSGFFNISTTAMFVLAAGGAQLIKHGNRGITSKSGGADVLQELQAPVDLPPEQTAECLKRCGLVFLFAPHYHPAFKAVAPVRKKLAQEGQPTIFNLLGPLLNPAQPEHQLAGIFEPRLLDAYAEILRLLGRTHAMVVHGHSPNGRGIDEASTLGRTEVRELVSGKIQKYEVRPEDFGIRLEDAEELEGGDPPVNAQILIAILEGVLKGPKRDIVELNAAAGFVAAELADDLQDGLELAREQIDNGNALAKLRLLQAFKAV